MINDYILISSLSLQIKYKEEWEKTKSKACDIGVDDLSVKAAKASRDLASDVSAHTQLRGNTVRLSWHLSKNPKWI